ncbi:hypothetical protein PIB30_075787 [Stylosanthes scabra]|uniref:Uncharacterized protein n=1 Tax=Stylosanthes scabra TaxID=79078 RepID=A0ABU6QPN1_9FABA|nr:hypothetical protein [Stylosanthes scabra]
MAFAFCLLGQSYDTRSAIAKQAHRPADVVRRTYSAAPPSSSSRLSAPSVKLPRSLYVIFRQSTNAAAAATFFCAAVSEPLTSASDSLSPPTVAIKSSLLLFSTI